MKSYSYQLIAEAISNLKEQSLGQALSRSGRLIFGRDSVKSTDSTIPQPGQFTSRAGSELRALAGTETTPSRTATYDPEQNKVVIRNIEPKFNIQRDVPADARGYVRGALKPLKGTTLRPSSLAKAMDTASQNIDLKRVGELESELRKSASKPDALPPARIPAALSMRRGLDILKDKFTTRSITGKDVEFTQPEVDLYTKSHIAAQTAASKALDSYLDPQSRSNVSSEIIGSVGKEREAMKAAGVPDDAIKRYEAGMRSAVYNPITDALGSAAKAQKARTAEIARDMKTIAKSGQFPYQRPKGAKGGFGVAMTPSGKGLAR